MTQSEDSQASKVVEADSSRRDHRGGIMSRSFLGLLSTQLLGTLNDNMFRWFAIKTAQDTMGDAEALIVGIVAVFAAGRLRGISRGSVQ